MKNNQIEKFLVSNIPDRKYVDKFINQAPRNYKDGAKWIKKIFQEIYQKGSEDGRKENIGAIDLKVSKGFNQELKKENGDLIKLVQGKVFREGQIDGVKGLLKLAIKKRDSYITYKEIQQYIKELEDKEYLSNKA